MEEKEGSFRGSRERVEGEEGGCDGPVVEEEEGEKGTKGTWKGRERFGRGGERGKGEE